ncbi:MAG: hypothetical protein ISN29_01450, partial [Gammaproteobacteria bacterium AqS3]|nr:hypothetical protein [Gammaproteobacteria bacterium AqS3]
VTVDTDTGAENNQNTLDFTNSNWDTAQTVTVNAARDADTTDDGATISLTASGGGYSDATGSVLVRVTENDETGLTIAPAKLTVDEGGSENFTVELTSRPSDSVQITLSQSGAVNTDVRLSKSSLRFTTDNWSTAQTVTVNAARDDDTTEDRATISLTASGGDYAGVTGSVPVTVQEKPKPELILSWRKKTIDEGDSITLKVRLKTKPSADVRVEVRLPDDAVRMAISPGRDLDFSASDDAEYPWNTDQNVAIITYKDPDAVDNKVTISLTASGGDYGEVRDSVELTVTDLYPDGLVLTPSTLEVAEGGSDTFKVTLALQPLDGAKVRVTLTQPKNSDVKVDTDPNTDGDQNTLDFTDSNWNTGQTVTVRVSHDADGTDDSATITLATSGNDYVGVTGSMLVAVTDDDSLGLTITPTALSVNEGGNNTFDVQLATKPSEDVTVTLAQPSNTDVTIADTDPDTVGNQTALTFTASNWNTAQTVTVSAVEDDDATDDRATISLSASDGGYDGVTGSVTVTVKDDDVGLEVSVTSLTVTEGGSNTFTVALASRPNADVTVTLGQDENATNTDVTLDKKSLTFTTGNWSTAQTITVSAAADEDAIVDTATVAIQAGDEDYADSNKTVTVNVTENDTTGLTLSTTSLGITEESSDTFTVALSSKPSGEVTVDLSRSGDTDVTVNPTSLSFTTSNWSQEQTVTVSAAADDDTDTDSATIKLTASGGDYGGVAEDVAVTVTDNDKPGLSLSPTSLTITEGGSKPLDVSLATQPSGNVTVALTQPDNRDVTVDKNSLTFTASDWNTAQTVTVSAAPDDDSSSESASITLSASGGDYGDVSGSVSVKVTDDDVDLEVSAATLEVTEGGNGTFTVQLAAKPPGDVRVVLSQDDNTNNTDVTLDKAALTFTASNWNQAQTVTVSAAEDSDADDESTAINLVAGDGDYSGEKASVTVNVQDNDTPGLTIESDSDPLAVEEGGEETFKVKLATPPTSNVTVTLTQPDNTDVTVDKTSLTFTTSDWKDAQTITVSAAEDDDAIADDATILLNTEGGGYDAIAEVSVSVAVTENDTLGLTLSTTSLTVTEGGSKPLDVSLSSEPSGDVMVTLTQEDNTANDDVTLGKESLTFTTSNWKDVQTVTVSAVHDDDSSSESALIILSASGGDYGDVTGSVSVKVTDDDVDLEVSATSLTVTEGGNGTFTVKLMAAPPSDVTVTLPQDDDTPNTDVMLDKAALTFTVSDWNQAQTVTVSAAEDPGWDDESTTINLVAGDGDYAGEKASVTVNVEDDDEAKLIITPAEPLEVDEEDSAPFSVKLGAQPSGDVRVTLTQPDNTDVTVDVDPNKLGNQTELTFTPDSWGTPQEVTVRAAHDPDTQDDNATINLTASGGGYVDVAAKV